MNFNTSKAFLLLKKTFRRLANAFKEEMVGQHLSFSMQFPIACVWQFVNLIYLPVCILRCTGLTSQEHLGLTEGTQVYLEKHFAVTFLALHHFLSKEKAAGHIV